jgi:hypothetical protein
MRHGSIRRPLVMLAIGFALVALAVPAWGAFSSGRYRGKTTQKLPVGFRVAKARVRSLTFTIDLKCSDGSTSRAIDSGFPSMPVSRSGRFSGNFDDSTGAENVRIAGRLIGKTARGTLRVTERLNARHQDAPKGKTLCDSRTRRYTARRG